MNVFILFGEMNIFILLGEINIDYYMTFFISYSLSAREPIGSRDDIWTRVDKGYDMKNDMLW
jgi:hypothetical protein